MQKHLSACLLCFLVGACSMPPAQTLPDSHVNTESGLAVGIARDDRVVHWLDIPYAEPPVGELRWRAPRVVTSTESVITGGDGSVMCPQMPSQTAMVKGDEPVGTEDCLYLDVVAPRDFRGSNYPVMFWIHGGGNTAGRKGTYDFADLAATQNVVVVSINYRLGPLGWMTHPAIQGGAEGLDRSSNFGTLDIIAALDWTQRNIAGFGGNPDNVTVFGESAGGHNIYSLLVSPLSAGLFHRAIVQSGYTTSVTPEQAINRDGKFEQIDRASWELIKSLGADPAIDDPDALRQFPADDIIRTYEGIPMDHVAPLTTADDLVIPAEGLEPALGNPDYRKNVPVLAGSNRDEVALWLVSNPYFVETSPILFGLLPEKYELRDTELFEYWVAMRSRAWKARGVDSPLAALDRAGYDALYAYRFDWDEQRDSWFIPFSKVLGPAHAAEIAFIMGKPFYGDVGGYMYPDSPSARELTGVMMSAWGGFARDGVPGDVRTNSWPPFSAEAPHTMIFDSPGEGGPRAESYSLDGLLQDIAMDTRLNGRERCILVWEMVTNIGDPAYGKYNRWSGGECAQVDARAERVAILKQYR